MNIFLSSSFRTDKDQKFLNRTKKILDKEGNVVWCAMDNIGDYYGTIQRSRLKEIIEIEKNEILKSDLFIALLKNPIPDTIMQIFYAAEYQIPVLIYLNLDIKDKSISLSPWLYHHGQIVKSESALLNALEIIKNKIEEEYT